MIANCGTLAIRKLLADHFRISDSKIEKLRLSRNSFPPYSKNLHPQFNLAVNKFLKHLHVLFVRADSNSRGRLNPMAKAAAKRKKPAAKKAAKKTVARKPAAKKTAKKKAA